MEQRVSLITLAVSDLERSASFYEGLGWARLDSGSPGIVVFDLLDQSLGLYSKEALAKDLGLPVEKIVAAAGVTFGYNVREAEEVDRLLALAVGAGGHIVQPPKKAHWGGYNGFFADPDGHIWEIAHNPFAPLHRETGAFRWAGFEQG